MAEALSSGSTPSGRKQVPRRRFRLAYAALGLVLAGAFAGLGALLATPGSKSGPPWSSWRPTKQSTEGASQIAQYVSRRYRLPSGGQLVGVFAGPPRVQNIPIAAFALRRGSSQRDISIVPARHGVVYLLFGLGANGSIPGARPSFERTRLIRREALELALYTFRYEEGADSVLAFLPPDTQPSTTLFFRKIDLREQLKRPLQKTLPGTATLESVRRDPERTTIDRLTVSRLYQFGIQQIPDGRVVLVLGPPQA